MTLRVKEFIETYNTNKCLLIYSDDPKKRRELKVWFEMIADPLRKRLEEAGVELKEIL